MERFGLYQYVPANTSEPFQGPGTRLSSHTSGVALPARVTSAENKVKTKVWLSWRLWHREGHLRFSVICVMGELHSPRGAPRSAWLCGPAARRALGLGCGEPLQELDLGIPRMGLWALGTPCAGTASGVALRFPGWGSRPPWGLPVCPRSSGRMISRAQIPRA